MYISAFEVLARHLGKVENKLKDIEACLHEIRKCVSPSSSSSTYSLPAEIKLPCDSENDLKKLEDLLTSQEYEQKLVRTFLISVCWTLK